MSKILGIDIGKSVIRVVILRANYRKIILEAMTEMAITGLETDAIRAAVGTHKPDGIAIAISGEKTYYRTVDLPASALKEIESVLPFELEAQLPFEMSEAVFDYRIDKRPVGSETLPIFSAIARTGDVRERIHIVKEALGIEPERVGTGALPLANLVSIMPGIEKPFGKDAPVGETMPPVALLDL
ncbi:MAG TPA: pilus assembly protein PilM, partial [Polyangium sp.]|nr:pilus assembly protein PilM [Polyangium sp.]